MIENTTIHIDPSAAALQVAVLRAFPTLEWRHHGIGVLQAYLKENSAPEVRVHIWHPLLERQGAIHEGGIHNHRFDMRSTVLLGSIEHVEYDVQPAVDGLWEKYEVMHARAGSALPEKLPGTFSKQNLRWTVHAGSAYEFKRGAFHRSHAAELTVTVVTKYNQTSDNAVILVPTGITPRHMFVENHKIDINAVVAAARDSMAREVGA